MDIRKTAVIYSSIRPRSDRRLLWYQTAMLEQIAKEHNVDVAYTIEEVHDGHQPERYQVNQIKYLICKNHIQALVLQSVERLFANRLDALDFIAYAKAHQIELITAAAII